MHSRFAASAMRRNVAPLVQPSAAIAPHASLNAALDIRMVGVDQRPWLKQARDLKIVITILHDTVQYVVANISMAHG